MGVLLAGCASAPKQKMTGIRLGMTQAELVQEWGAPARSHTPVVNGHGQTEVVVEYERERDVAGTGTGVAKEVIKSGSSGFFDDPTKKQRYVFHFIDDRLARWGKDTSTAKPGEEPAPDVKKDQPKPPPVKDQPKPPVKDPAKDPTKVPPKDPAKDPSKG